MSAWQRFLATIVIWGGITITLIVLFAIQASGATRPFSEPMVFALVLIIMGGAVAATRAVWQAVREIAAQERAAYATKTKRSHTSRLARLIESLDEDEFYDLEARLHEREQRHRN